jgi:MYXO-CTERM domain-containing protein
MNSRMMALIFAALFFAGNGVQASTNLLVNGSFEANNGLYQTDFLGWTDSLGAGFACEGDASGCGRFSVVSGAEDGSWYMVDSATFRDDLVSQSFADTAGLHYLVSGWVASGGPFNGSKTQPADWSLSIDGQVFASENPAQEQGWMQYVGAFVGMGSDTLTIASLNDSNFNYFDNFSVTTVPDPAPWSMMLLGLSLAGVRLRRRPAAATSA